MLGEAFTRELEDTISQKVATAVRELHDQFVAAHEQRWQEFLERSEAERSRLETSGARAAEEQKKLLEQTVSASSEAEAKAKQAAASLAQAEDLRQELVGKQRGFLDEVRALLDESRRTVAAQVAQAAQAAPQPPATPAPADGAETPQRTVSADTTSSTPADVVRTKSRRRPRRPTHTTEELQEQQQQQQQQQQQHQHQPQPQAQQQQAEVLLTIEYSEEWQNELEAQMMRLSDVDVHALCCVGGDTEWGFVSGAVGQLCGDIPVKEHHFPLRVVRRAALEEWEDPEGGGGPFCPSPIAPRRAPSSADIGSRTLGPAAACIEVEEYEDSELALNEPGELVEEGVTPLLKWGRKVSDMSLTAGEHAPRPESQKLMLSLKFLLLGLVTVLLMGMAIFPFSTVGLLSIICLWLLYLCGEEPVIRLVESRQASQVGCNRKWFMLARALRVIQSLRSSHDKENCFKAVLYALSVCLLLWFNPEFGLARTLFGGGTHPLMAPLWLLGALLANIYIFNVFLLGNAYAKRSFWSYGQVDSPRGGSEAAQGVMGQIRQCLQQSGWSSRRGSHRKIYDLLAHSDKFVLNELIEQMSLSKDCSLSVIMGHFQGDSRSELIDLLCETRAGELSIQSKSVLLHTLMIMRLSSCRSAESGVESLLLSAEGDDLSRLKSSQDGQGDIHSMHKLVFEDIKDEEIQVRLLNHFLVEGAEQVARRALMASGHFQELLVEAKRRRCVPETLRAFEDSISDAPISIPQSIGNRGHSWVKIITDIDDTLQCSAARWPAGIDGRYPKHTLYPGVTAFYRELQGGSGSGQLVALSARPHIVGDMVEQGVFKRFRQWIDVNGLHTMPALLTGSVDAGGKYLLSGGDDSGLRALCEKKYDSFKQYLSLYPEFRMVFIGDNGQADYALAQRMCREFPHNMLHAWIHEVQPQSKTWKYEKDFDAPIDYFSDYVMAAVSAATLTPHPLISPEGLRSVAIAATEDFKRIQHWQSEAQREAEVNRLNQSILRACQVMSFLGVDDDVDLVDAERRVTGSDGDSDAQHSDSKSSFLGMAWAKGTFAARMLARAPPPVAPKAGCQDVETQTAAAEGQELPEAAPDRSPRTPSERPVVPQLVPLQVPPLSLPPEPAEARATRFARRARDMMSGGGASQQAQAADTLSNSSPVKREKSEALHDGTVGQLPGEEGALGDKVNSDVPADTGDGLVDDEPPTRSLFPTAFTKLASTLQQLGTLPEANSSNATSGGEGSEDVRIVASLLHEGHGTTDHRAEAVERRLAEAQEALQQRDAELAELRARLAALEGGSKTYAVGKHAGIASEDAAPVEDSSLPKSLFKNVRRAFSSKAVDGDASRQRRRDNEQASPAGKPRRSPDSSATPHPSGWGEPTALLLPSAEEDPREDTDSKGDEVPELPLPPAPPSLLGEPSASTKSSPEAPTRAPAASHAAVADLSCLSSGGAVQAAATSDAAGAAVAKAAADGLGAADDGRGSSKAGADAAAAEDPAEAPSAAEAADGIVAEVPASPDSPAAGQSVPEHPAPAPAPKAAAAAVPLVAARAPYGPSDGAAGVPHSRTESERIMASASLVGSLNLDYRPRPPERPSSSSVSELLAPVASRGLLSSLVGRGPARARAPLGAQGAEAASGTPERADSPGPFAGGCDAAQPPLARSGAEFASAQSLLERVGSDAKLSGESPSAPGPEQPVAEKGSAPAAVASPGGTGPAARDASSQSQGQGGGCAASAAEPTEAEEAPAATPASVVTSAWDTAAVFAEPTASAAPASAARPAAAAPGGSPGSACTDSPASAAAHAEAPSAPAAAATTAGAAAGDAASAAAAMEPTAAQPARLLSSEPAALTASRSLLHRLVADRASARTDASPAGRLEAVEEHGVDADAVALPADSLPTEAASAEAAPSTHEGLCGPSPAAGPPGAEPRAQQQLPLARSAAEFASAQSLYDPASSDMHLSGSLSSLSSSEHLALGTAGSSATFNTTWTSAVASPAPAPKEAAAHAPAPDSKEPGLPPDPPGGAADAPAEERGEPPERA